MNHVDLAIELVKIATRLGHDMHLEASPFGEVFLACRAPGCTMKWVATVWTADLDLFRSIKQTCPMP